MATVAVKPASTTTGTCIDINTTMRATPELEKRKKTKLPRDSIIVYIPLNVTADLGVAMKRSRAKNIAKYKQLQPHLFEKKDGNEDKDKSLTVVDDGSNAGSMNTSEEDGDSQMQETEKKMMDMDKIGSEVCREQFSSIVDYLEAKYARGVMIHDLDERIREKKKKKNTDGKAGEGDDLSVLSDSEAGSCYSEESGVFIDDSDLRTDVAHQIFASSAFGTTKIEADAVKARARGDGGDDDSLGADDHAFFVNIGDLEMEDGWNDDIEEDQDWLTLKKSKGKKRKRSLKDSTNAKGTSKDKKVSKKTKTDEKKKENTSDKKKTKSKPKKDAASIKSDASKKSKNAPKSKESKKGENSKKEKSSAVKVKVKTEVSVKTEEAKKEAVNLKRKADRLYKKCVEEIGKMTEEHLPRKPKKGGVAKCQVIVPEGKSAGDSITINNPHIPGQRLKVSIPKNRVPGDKFPVKVPLPSVRKSGKLENKFTKESMDALDKFSSMYDEYCQAEAKYRLLLPKKKGVEPYKVGVERLKKYDKMLTTFPKRLEVPIEPAFLRLLVRRRRQNQNKRVKKEGSESASVTTVATPIKKEKKPNVMKLQIPQASQKFPTITYNVAHFVVTAVEK